MPADPSCPVVSLPRVRVPAPGERLAHLARGDGVVDKPFFVARGVSPLWRDEPAVVLDAAGPGGYHGVCCIPFHLSEEVRGRGGGAAPSAV